MAHKKGQQSEAQRIASQATVTRVEGVETKRSKAKRKEKKEPKKDVIQLETGERRKSKSRDRRREEPEINREALEQETATPEKDEVIRLGEPQEEIKFKSVSESVTEALQRPLGDPRGLKTTAALGSILALATGLSAFIGAGAAATATATGGAVTATGVTIRITNAKIVGLGGSLASKVFSAKVLGFAGVAAWVSSVGFGLWGVAESPEPISIAQTKFLIPEAQRTGDWTAVDEAEDAKAELLSLATWEKILLGTPAAAVVGSLKKIEGAAVGASLLSQFIGDEKTAQENGETEDAKWERIRQQEKDQQIELQELYTQSRKDLVLWEQEAKAAGDQAAAKLWARERDKERAKEAKDRQAVADFWIAYRKQSKKFQEDARPSNLNFGLL